MLKPEDMLAKLIQLVQHSAINGVKIGAAVGESLEPLQAPGGAHKGNSFTRLDAVKRIDPWAFAIDSAFFDKKFITGGTFREQLVRVLDYLEK